MSSWGLKITDKKPPLDSLEINQLDANNVNAFDRSATRQDPSYMEQAWNISDIGMRGSLLLPALLMLDKEIRQIYRFSHVIDILKLRTISDGGSI